MDHPLFTVRPERAEDVAVIEALNEVAFGPGRHARTAYRLREGVPPDPDLSLVADDERSEVVAGVRLTPIAIGGRPALLLGPLVVHPHRQGQGAGKLLVRTALDLARKAGHKVVLLVGDEPYYGPLGFQKLAPYQVTLPGPADPARVLVAGLAPGALDGLSGMAEKARP
jgi:predicted N-acetyltransferase YhbS